MRGGVFVVLEAEEVRVVRVVVMQWNAEGWVAAEAEIHWLVALVLNLMVHNHVLVADAVGFSRLSTIGR